MKQSDFGTISCFGAPSACEASLALTRSVQRWRTKNIRIQSGVALSTAVRGRILRSCIIGPTPIDAAYGTRGTYGDNAKPPV